MVLAEKFLRGEQAVVSIFTGSCPIRLGKTAPWEIVSLEFLARR